MLLASIQNLCLTKSAVHADDQQEAFFRNHFIDYLDEQRLINNHLKHRHQFSLSSQELDQEKELNQLSLHFSLFSFRSVGFSLLFLLFHDQVFWHLTLTVSIWLRFCLEELGNDLFLNCALNPRRELEIRHIFFLSFAVEHIRVDQSD